VVSHTVTPTLVERDYYVWTGSHFRQAAVETKVANITMEILFDQPLPVDTEQSISGKARAFVNGVDQGEFPWGAIVTSAGVETVTVPAGTFLNAHRWKRIFEFGAVRQIQSADSIGLVDLRVDAPQYVDGVLKSTTRQELLSGPVQ